MEKLIEEFLNNRKATLLCSGPMSKNCIDASIEISTHFNIPQILIASRRQVDSRKFGNGYVENFSTESFIDYIKTFDCPNIFIARDHGGPYQGNFEKENNLNIEDSMKIAKQSFEEDIINGFDYIHIDPSVPIQEESLSQSIILNRLFELYGHTYEYAQINSKNIKFELGTEEQNGYGQDLDKFEFFLNETNKFCLTNKMQSPSFVVAQTGTKVIEMENIGIFNKAEQSTNIDFIEKTLAICSKYNVMLKEHNTDYLDEYSLSLRPIIGIHASNVAPEFGVVETKAFLYILKLYGFEEEFQLFVDTAIRSNKWKKWMKKNSSATDLEKAYISGHYIFSNNKIIIMKQDVKNKLLVKKIDLDNYLKRFIKQSMLKYLQLFNMI